MRYFRGGAPGGTVPAGTDYVPEIGGTPVQLALPAGERVWLVDVSLYLQTGESEVAFSFSSAFSVIFLDEDDQKWYATGPGNSGGGGWTDVPGSWEVGWSLEYLVRVPAAFVGAPRVRIEMVCDVATTVAICNIGAGEANTASVGALTLEV